MSEKTFRLPDIGEGIAEAEVAEWRVRVGDVIGEDDVICEVTTDKATIEIPASAGGRVTWLGGRAGEVLAIGSDLIRIETDETAAPEPGSGPAVPEAAAQRDASDPAGARAEAVAAAVAPPARPETTRRAASDRAGRAATAATGLAATGATGRPLAAPSVRGRAREMGIDLRQLRGTGPAGRITHADLEDFAAHGAAPLRQSALVARDGAEAVPLGGIRRAIAGRMALSKARIPHFSIVEEVDVEALEELRAGLNRRFGAERGKLTLLPFLIRALSEAVLDHPEINAHYDDTAEVVTRHAALHCGIATQTPAGLMVPVLRHAEALNPWQAAREIRQLSDKARDRRATPKELTGSTLTITSLGPLGAIATTPIINHPEVAIVGVNRIAVRPVWTGSAFAPRRMMNLSCSFDHRVVDGWVAAEFVAKLKSLLEMPALLFMEWRDD